MTSRLLIWYWGRRGAGTLVTLLLARRLIEAGYGNQIALSLSRQNEIINEFKHLQVPLSTVDTFEEKPSSLGLLKLMPSLANALRNDLDRFRPTTVLVPMLFGACLPLWPVARGARRKFFYIAHDSRSHPGEAIGLEQSVVQYFLFRLSDRLITMSDYIEADLLKRFPNRKDSIYAESLGGLYNSKCRGRTAREGQRLKFLVAGRQIQYKGYERLAQALSMISNHNFDIIIAGDGPERGRILELFSSYSNITFRQGWATPNEHQKLFDENDVLLCPYDEASQSALICDALVQSMPSVVTPIGALPEQIGHGKAGWVTSDMSAAALANTLTKVARGGDDYKIASEACRDVLTALQEKQNWAKTLQLNDTLK